jgi:hypothetical protein
VYLVYAFFTWEATGAWPLNVPNLNVPAIPVPSFLHPVQQESPTLHRLVNQVSSNWVTIFLGTAAGLVFGIFLVGLIADMAKALFRFGRRSEQTVVAEVESDPMPSESA